MNKKLKDIVYPTIKKQFDNLTPHYTVGNNRFSFSFSDGKGTSYLVYNRAIGLVVVSLEFFYLNYFGVDEDGHNYDVAIMFVELLKEKLGDDFEFWAVKPEDVIFYSYKKLN